jgi:hypothetical protein
MTNNHTTFPLAFGIEPPRNYKNSKTTPQLRH